MSLVNTALAGSKALIGHGARGLASNPGAAIGGGMFLADTNRYSKQGNNLGTSVMKAGVENILYATNPALMTGIQLAPLAVQGAVAAHDFRKRRAEEIHTNKYNNSRRVGGDYMDTSQAQTMRQAALQQIQGNKLNARSALGGEARIFANKFYS